MQPLSQPPINCRNLPHIEPDGRAVFVTFSTWKRWILPERVRQKVVEHCLHDHGKKLEMHALVVMPDHVHILFSPLADSEGVPFTLSHIMQGIKGASAHSINKLLSRKGKVWQDESFDRILRTDEKVFEKGEYICQNPIRRGLVKLENDYAWLWRQWKEGRDSVVSIADQERGDSTGIQVSNVQPGANVLTVPQPRAAVLQVPQPGAAVLHGEKIDPRVELGIPLDRLPRHIAIIMDGNGRWAQRQGLPRVRGHEAGAANVREIVTHAARLGIGQLTLYSFSTENWNRPLDEITHLMRLYVEYLIKERAEIMDNDIRLVQIGRREGLPDEVLHELDETARLSRDNKGMTLCLALNYSSRAEITDAVREIARRVVSGALSPSQIDDQTISNALYTADMPDPDLLIRTAGEMRVSNFLLWQISYAELHVTDVLWPEFGRGDLNTAIKDYAGRDRRFGAL